MMSMFDLVARNFGTPPWTCSFLYDCVTSVRNYKPSLVPELGPGFHEKTVLDCCKRLKHFAIDYFAMLEKN